MNASHTLRSATSLREFLAALHRKAQRSGIVTATSMSTEGVTAGVYRARVTPSTGALVAIFDAKQTNVRTRHNWHVLCISHEQSLAQQTRQDCYDLLREPVFCSKCAALMGVDVDRRSQQQKRDDAAAEAERAEKRAAAKRKRAAAKRKRVKTSA